MHTADDILQLYQELAAWHEEHGPAHVRDRFLILAADAALGAGREEEADRLRLRLLRQNPHHMLKPFASLEQALGSPDVRHYVNDLRLSYPYEVATGLLAEIRGSNGSPPADASSAVPPTLPVINLDGPPARPRGRGPDPVVVYLGEEPAEQAPPPRPNPAKQPPIASPPPRPAAPVPAPASAGSGKLARLAAARRRTSPRPLEPIHRPASPMPSESEEENAALGQWVVGILFGVMLVLSTGLAAYTLARPFLPTGWP